MKRFFLTLIVIVFSDFATITSYPDVMKMINDGEKIENADIYKECISIVNDDSNADDILLPYLYIVLGEYHLQAKDWEVAVQCFYEALSFYEDVNQDNPSLISAFPEKMQEYFKKNLTYNESEEGTKEVIKDCLKQIYKIQ